MSMKETWGSLQITRLIKHATTDSHCCCRTQHAWHSDADLSVSSVPVALGVSLGLGEYEGDLGLSADDKLI